MLVYAINDDTSFEKLDHIRELILREQKRAVPIFLIGSKSDLSSQRAVTASEAQAKAAKWGATCKFFEVSAMTGANIADVFEAITETVLETTTDPSKGAGGGSIFAGGVAGSTPETEAAAGKSQRRCTIL